VRKLPLPAWYLPNGKKNALELELERASSSCERWAIWCGAGVVFAVAAELIIAWCDPPYEKWRKISPEQEALLKHFLSKLSGASVVIWHFIHDPESENFAQEIAAIFRLSQWITWVNRARFGGNFAFDVRVPSAEGEDEKASKAAQEAFTNAGIEFSPLSIPSIEMYTGGQGSAPLGHPQAEIYIGPKGRHDA
jgi:hypothetical protein